MLCCVSVRRCQITKLSFCVILWTLKIALIEPHAMQATTAATTAATTTGALQWPHIKQTDHVLAVSWPHPNPLAVAAVNALRCTYTHPSFSSMCKLSMRMPCGLDIGELPYWRIGGLGYRFYAACARMETHFTALLISERYVSFCIKSETKLGQLPPSAPGGREVCRPSKLTLKIN